MLIVFRIAVAVVLSSFLVYFSPQTRARQDAVSRQILSQVS